MTIPEAHFIAANIEPDTAPIFRIEFDLEPGHGAVRSAVISLSALGICEAWLNGQAITDALYTPGWTSYEWRVHYTDHDVTALLVDRSVLGIRVGNGWYRGRLGWIETERYGTEIAAYAKLVIDYADGHRQIIATDESWTVGPSAVTANDFYDGQSIDARLHDDRWMQSGFTSEAWGGVHVVTDTPSLELDPAPPVRRVDTLKPQKIWDSPSGQTLIDFGQNIVGFVRVRVRGKSGDQLTLRHAEVLENGELAVRPLRSAASVDRYILSGGDDVFEPTLTFHGFRYAEITAWPEEVDLAEALEAVVVSSDLQRIGYFECSVPELNQFHSNVVWGMRGNFVDIPTDCPQRDERLGWTGDISSFAPTAAFLFDVKDFLTDWLRDLALEQSARDGLVPYIVPDILKYAKVPQPGAGAEEAAAFWSDAAVWVPWALWQAYGDRDVLTAAYESMVAHGRRVTSLLSESGVWDSGFQFGDWLDPDAPADQPGAAKADPGVVATACAYRTADTIRQTALLLGHAEVAAEFSLISAHIRDGFHREYVDGERITSDCTTVYALAIAFGLLDEHEQEWAGARLAELVAASGFHISTGFAGTPFITEALTATGHTSTAYRLLLQRECPSWLYPVSMGATTIWERWDSMLPDGSINPGDMTSFNHYSLGSVADWIHRVVGGIAPLEPGYRRILVAPQLDPAVEWASTRLRTPHGWVAVNWRQDDDATTLDVIVPTGTVATVRLGGYEQHLPAGRHEVRVAAKDIAATRAA
ncbi:alpha-L-rhamnosidase [Microbacterium terrae]|uniref:alpha-L-rhamnosidase n=1 Tax=Microbacterium terrae TaxID=69369 RepID=A0A0M2HJI5_9MICO|nr:alpha-L-rhamnosidase [Microbacterium terrae]KJL44523.1 Bacterial alpha-L-rhamnosidase [Microbacterium terrae]MBP1079474.1 alpha-L-rhamnosidase [Microbacterium terrae]GLJ96815.1 alpha-L-rhamnosidase [Microbacterium terrae]